jgi:phosphoribosylglycinamide formyltransferase-1
MTIRIGALISGGGSNLQAILDACRTGAIPGKMVFVGSDNKDAYGLKRAQAAAVPVFTVDYREKFRAFQEAPDRFSPPADFDLAAVLQKEALTGPDADELRRRAYFIPRAAAEAALLEEMASYPFDLLVLAGFMRNLTPYFIDRVNPDPNSPRIMNIHPALLPAFPGTDGYGDTFRYGCKVGGCTVHFIDYGEDTGPIIAQRAVSITPEDTLESFRKKGLAAEWAVYPECIRMFAENRLVVDPVSTDSTGRRVVRILPEGGGSSDALPH